MNRNNQTILRGFIIAAFACLAVAGASAATVTGNLWHLSPDSATDVASPSLIPGSTPDVTFDASSSLSFNAGFGPTVGAWLSSGGAFNVSENTAGTLASLMSNGSTVGTVIDFKGTINVLNGQTFTFTHDDGIYLGINGVNLGFDPNPTSPFTETETWGGASGSYPFELVYTENHGGDAQLIGDLGSVPDGGSTLALLGAAMTMIGLVSRRFRK